MKIEIEQYCAERDAVLRKLDVAEFERFYSKHRLKRPREGWLDPEVPLIMMHKARLQIVSFSDEERALSRKWLLDRGYSLPPGTP